MTSELLGTTRGDRYHRRMPDDKRRSTPRRSRARRPSRKAYSRHCATVGRSSGTVDSSRPTPRAIAKSAAPSPRASVRTPASRSYAAPAADRLTWHRPGMPGSSKSPIRSSACAPSTTSKEDSRSAATGTGTTSPGRHRTRACRTGGSGSRTKQVCARSCPEGLRPHARRASTSGAAKACWMACAAPSVCSPCCRSALAPCASPHSSPRRKALRPLSRLFSQRRPQPHALLRAYARPSCLRTGAARAIRPQARIP